jgi:molecular chaperone GrpE
MAGYERVPPEPSTEPRPGGPAAGHGGVGDQGAGPGQTIDQAGDADDVTAADTRAGGDPDADVRSDTDGTAEDPLKVALTQRDEYLDSLRRLQAEFENYRKRVTSQQAEQAARAASLLVDKLLPVLDTLDLAVQHLGDADSADGKALVASGNQLHAVLTKEGLERIDPLGEVFDPTSHEAVGHVPADDGDAGDDDDRPLPKPVVAQVMRPGYADKTEKKS